MSICSSGALYFTKVHIHQNRRVGDVWREAEIPPRDLLSCTYCSALLIFIIERCPRVCLKQLGTEYVQLWSTFLYQGAHTKKQEGTRCVKKGWNSPKASTFLHILLRFANHNHKQQSRSVILWTRNWVCAFVEHFLLPTSICLYLKVWQVIRGVDSYSAAAFLHILLSIRNHKYNEESSIVLVWTRNWGKHFWSTFFYQRALAYFLRYGRWSQEWIPTVLLLFCTFCSALLIKIIIRSPGVCLNQ